MSSVMGSRTWLILWPFHGATCEDEGVVAHVRGCKVFAGQVRDPITELIVTCRDEASLFAVQGVEDREG